MENGPPATGSGANPAVALLRGLPSVGRLLELAAGRPDLASFPPELTADAIRAVVDRAREGLLGGRLPAAPGESELLATAAARLADLTAPTLHPVINASGVIVHTNLGRATLSLAAQEAVTEAGASYSTLEFDLAAGKRGSRSVHAAALLEKVTGAEAAHVVNNTAAAVLLMLTTLCRGQEVVISRGQLIEIGGGFRVPDVMAQSGARLVEVGTTNRTHLRDYAAAIGPETAAILVAHHSNFKVIGFTAEPALDELATLAHDHGLPLLYDQGSGCLLDTTPFGLEAEPTVQAGLAAGCDLVTFSGDKLLGGPQAGILVGRSDLVESCRRHPLARAVRPDKLCLAGLAATLHHYLRKEAVQAIPVWQMIARPAHEIAAIAQNWAEALAEAGVPADTSADVSTVGGGSLPGTTLPTTVVTLTPPSAEELGAALRGHPPHVISRIQDGRVLLDPRTVLPAAETALIEAVGDAWRRVTSRAP